MFLQNRLKKLPEELLNYKIERYRAVTVPLKYLLQTELEPDEYVIELAKCVKDENSKTIEAIWFYTNKQNVYWESHGKARI